MHSRIFIIAKDLKEVDLLPALHYEDMLSIGADSVVKESDYQFKNSVEWLKNYYSLKKVKYKQMRYDNTEIPIAVINVKELLSGLAKRIEERWEDVKRAYEKRDLWEIAYHAYNRKGFYFIMYKDNWLMNEVDFYSIYKDREDLGDSLYIICSWDYHY